MEKKFQAKVNDQFHFELTEKDAQSLDITTLNEEHYHILVNAKSYQAQIVKHYFNQKTYDILINNAIYSVKLSNDLDLLIKQMGFESGASKLINAIKAPMPGLILEINVAVGQEVKSGDNLLILEAMKMENSFDSPRDGIIKSIEVIKGQAVEKGQLLIEFE